MPAAKADPTPPTNLDHALTYARRRWRVIPIPAGEKFPRGITAWQTEGSTDEAKIRHWWTNAPDHGIGIVTGATSGLWVLDVDVAGDKVGDETLAELCDAYGPLPPTYEVITGSGGRHLYFAWPDGQIVTNSASGRLGPGLDVRGEGGFVVAPPSLHANGSRYETEASAPDHVAPAPAWLLAMLEDPEPVPVAHRAPSTPAGDRPGDLYAASTTWAQILEADGWTLHHVDNDGEEHWTRPGKERRDGTSATTGYKGSDVLKVFTSSMPLLAADETYTKFGYLAATKYANDFKAARAALIADGYGGPTTNVTEVATMDAAPVDADAPWPEPIPLGASAELPAFPAHVLPDWITDHADEVARDIQVPIDLPATLAIGALSTIATGKVKVAVWGRWTEHANLFLVVAMPPSTGKSPAYKAMCSPVIELEAEYGRMVRAEMAANADAVDILEGQLKRAKQNEAVELDVLASLRQRLFDAMEKPTTPPKFTVGDATPEVLAKLIADNGGRMAVHSTEGGVFGLMAGRYSERANLDVYLQAWSGDRMDTARIGRAGNEAAEALLTMVLTVQPDVIRALADNPELAGRGLTARFMYSMPPDVLGERDLGFHSRPDTGAGDTYWAKMLDLGRQFLTWQRPAVLHLHDDAATHYSDWRQALERRRKPDGDLRPMAEWTGKLESSVLRLAAILHVAHGHHHETPMTVATVAQAIAVGEYWLAHATHVHDLWGTPPAVADARKILAWMMARPDPQAPFTPRDLYSDRRRDFPTKESTVGPLELLMERGWLRVTEGNLNAHGRGKKAPRITPRPGLSTEVARIARIAPRDTKNTLSLSLDTDTAGRPRAQSAQCAQLSGSKVHEPDPPPPPPAIPAGPLFDRPGVLPPELPDDLTAPTEETTAP